MERFDENDFEYQQAKRQVERLRGFYVHLFIYIVINLFIVYYNYTDLKPGESYFQFKNFFTATFWGIGLLAHGITVFLPRTDVFRKWEDKKIREILDKQNKR